MKLAVYRYKNVSIGIVFQDFALFPHKTVEENILFALVGTKISKKEKEAILDEMVATMDIANLLGRYPGTLSGGEAQRVALARTLVKKPKSLVIRRASYISGCAVAYVDMRASFDKNHQQRTTIVTRKHHDVTNAGS